MAMFNSYFHITRGYLHIRIPAWGLRRGFVADSTESSHALDATAVALGSGRGMEEMQTKKRWSFFCGLVAGAPFKLYCVFFIEPPEPQGLTMERNRTVDATAWQTLTSRHYSSI